jgi:uncharacterized surface protein with fasciclin (FAS1) repeats
MTSTLRRTSAVAGLAVALAGGLTACGSNGTGVLATSAGTAPTVLSAAGVHTFGPGCSAVPATGTGSFDGMVNNPVATAASDPLLSTLVTAITRAGLVNTLNRASGLTVFAPTNDAFGKLPRKVLARVLANKKLLREVLIHHVVDGQLDPSQVIGRQTTLNKDKLTVRGSTSGMTVDGAHVLCGNIATSNATVYVIDSVLLPRM